MDLNQDIIPQISFSIRAGLGEQAGGSGGREGERKMINQKIESCCLKPGGALGAAQHFTSNLTQRHLSVGSETGGGGGLTGLTGPAWS